MSVAHTADAAPLAATDHIYRTSVPLQRSTARLAPPATTAAALDASASLPQQVRADNSCAAHTTNHKNLSVWRGAGRSSRLTRPVDTGAGRRGAPNAAGGAPAEPADPAPALLPHALRQGDREDGDDGAAPGEQGAALAERTRDGAVAGRSPQAFGSKCEQPLASQAARREAQTVAGRLGQANAAALRGGALAGAPASADESPNGAPTGCDVGEAASAVGRRPQGGAATAFAPCCSYEAAAGRRSSSTRRRTRRPPSCVSSAACTTSCSSSPAPATSTARAHPSPHPSPTHSASAHTRTHRDARAPRAPPPALMLSAVSSLLTTRSLPGRFCTSCQSSKGQNHLNVGTTRAEGMNHLNIVEPRVRRGRRLRRRRWRRWLRRARWVS